MSNAARGRRPESHVRVDAINCDNVIELKIEWSSRWAWLAKIPAFDSFDAIDAARFADRLSLTLLSPKQLLDVDLIKAAQPGLDGR